MQSKAIAIENDLRATLRNFGLKVGTVGTIKFEARIKELVENLPDLASNRRMSRALVERMKAGAAKTATVLIQGYLGPDHKVR
jgi:hypothetical protein